MRGDLVVFPMFLVTLLLAAISFWINIRLAKAKIGRWESSSTVWFLMSAGNFGQKQVAFWQRNAGYSQEEAYTIIGYQLLSVLGAVLGFFVSALLGALVIS